MRRLYLLRKPRRMLPCQAAVAQIRKDLCRERVPLLLKPLQVGGQLFVHASPDPVPEVHVRPIEQRIVGFPTDQGIVLIPPAPPRRLSVEDSVGLLERPSGDLRQEFLPLRARMPHDGVEKAGVEEAVDILPPFASDIRIIPEPHAVVIVRRSSRSTSIITRQP